jgi:hypothetical protein
MAAKINPVIAKLQLPEGYTVRKVGNALKVVLARKHKAAIVKKETTMSNKYGISSYEEYDEQISFVSWFDWEGPTVEELEAEYPKYAARAKAEADARRGGTLEEHQARQEAENPPEEELIFVLDGPRKEGDVIQSGKHCYKAVKDSWFVSPKDADEDAKFTDMHTGSGWYTKARLVAA